MNTPVPIDAETGEVAPGWPDWWRSTDDLTASEAEKITAQITAYVGVTWRLISIAHDRKAHRALGYATFADYLRERFDMSKSQGYRLIAHAKILELLAEAAGLPDVSPLGTPEAGITEGQTRGIDAESAAADAADRAEALPDDATEQDRVDIVRRTVTEHHESRKTSASAPTDAGGDDGPAPSSEDPGPEAPPLAPEPGSSSGHAAQAGGDDAEPPAPSSPPATDQPEPEVDPDLAFRANSHRAMAAVRDHLRRLEDVDRLARVHDADGRDDLVALANHLVDWSERLGTAIARPNHLRRVQ